MRMLMTVQMNTEASNHSIKDGRLPKMMEATLKELHPEAAYFTTHEGDRTAYIVFDLDEPVRMPEIAEPFFMELQAKVDWSPVMNADEMQQGVARLAHM